MLPVVGYVIRERILRSVLLPAPLRPTRPSTSPLSRRKLTSFNAHSSDPALVRRPLRDQRLTIASRSIVGRSACPRRYRLERCSTLIAVIAFTGGIHATSANSRSVLVK